MAKHKVTIMYTWDSAKAYAKIHDMTMPKQVIIIDGKEYDITIISVNGTACQGLKGSEINFEFEDNNDL